MAVATNIIPVPLYAAPLWPSNRENALFASGETAGSGPRVREPVRILIVEDDLLVAAQVETTLTEAGFDIVGVATTGEEAIEIAGKDPPDLAVMDVRLAGDRDGVDTALELFGSHGIRCIFASAHTDDEARQRAESGAPFGWLQKPYTMASLTHMVRTAVNEVRDKGRRQN